MSRRKSGGVARHTGRSLDNTTARASRRPRTIELSASDGMRLTGSSGIYLRHHEINEDDSSTNRKPEVNVPFRGG